jgi:hypothetical protein
MRIFKIRAFVQFAAKKDIEDKDLIKAIQEMEDGLIDANLGGGVYKKRVARQGQGKSRGYRVIVCFRQGNRSFFVYGFAKSDQENISSDDLADFKDLARLLLNMTEERLELEIGLGTFVEVKEGKSEKVQK